MEFMSQGVPVVVSKTKVDSFYFEEGTVHFFPSGNVEALASAILDVVNNPEFFRSLTHNGYEYVKRHGWDRKKKEYLDLIDSLSTEEFEEFSPAKDLSLRPRPAAFRAAMPAMASTQRQNPGPVDRVTEEVGSLGSD
jgi:dienelactone hydrolase